MSIKSNKDLLLSVTKCKKTTAMKTKFSQMNDKRYYYLNGVTSLPIEHPYLNDITAHKEKKGQKIEKYFEQKKKNLKKLERDVFSKNSRLNIYNQIFSQNVEYCDLKTNKKNETDNLKINYSQSPQSYILESKWL